MTHLPLWTWVFLLLSLETTAEQRINQVAIAPSKPHRMDSGAREVQHELKKAGIFPTVIDEFLPSFLLDAEWPSGERAKLGNTVEVDEVQDEPTITAHRGHGHEHGSDVTYAVVITDPDAPSRDNPKWSEFCHFIATGVGLSSGPSATRLSLSGLKAIVPYQPPGPPAGTGKHRYVFLLLEPANGTSGPLHLTKPGARKQWGTGKPRHGVRDWAEENGLKPAAANFVYAQNEEQ